MITATVIGDRELVSRLGSAFDLQKHSLQTAVTRLTIELQGLAKKKVSGDVLKVGRGKFGGRLRSSINERVEISSMAIVGKVGIDGKKVPYAAIHEYGGTIPAHDIMPVNAQALAFMWHGKQMILKKVHIPDVIMPERSYLRSSLADMKEEIIMRLKMSLIESTKKAIAK